MPRPAADFDQEMVGFVDEWRPFGGADDEDTFIRFGLTWAQLCERVDALSRLAAQSDPHPQ
ncbi:hypothetical protein ACQI4F_08825 [Mycolicibacterium vaccae]|uniref:hypothetical protein n=1 Tax=Mycolicibacterium vaccae TaxID=1810 RepID=UPI003CF76160